MLTTHSPKCSLEAASLASPHGPQGSPPRGTSWQSCCAQTPEWHLACPWAHRALLQGSVFQTCSHSHAAYKPTTIPPSFPVAETWVLQNNLDPDDVNSA